MESKKKGTAKLCSNDISRVHLYIIIYIYREREKEIEIEIEMVGSILIKSLINIPIVP